MALDILLTSDDPAFADGLAGDLRDLDCTVAVVSEAREASTALRAGRFDAAIVEGGSSHLDGLSLLRAIRSAGHTLPIVMLATSAAVSEVVEGLAAGADDHVVRSVGAAELHARLSAILRGRRWGAQPADTIRAGDIVVAPTSFRAWHAGKPIDLPRLEFALLVELARSADRVLTRAVLIERVWGYATPPATNILDVHIRRLRAKLGAEAADRIVTMRGVGYMLRG